MNIRKLRLEKRFETLGPVGKIVTEKNSLENSFTKGE
jgi:hypothetical protein